MVTLQQHVIDLVNDVLFIDNSDYLGQRHYDSKVRNLVQSPPSSLPDNHLHSSRMTLTVIPRSPLIYPISPKT